MTEIFGTSIADLAFSGYIFNAAGPRDATYEELLLVARSESAAITMKSCTMEPRNGNPEPRYAFTPQPFGSVSTSGLPNLGYKAYMDLAARMKREFPGKPVIASVAGLALHEFPILVDAFQNSHADLIEVNLHSCPKEKGAQQIAHDPEAVDGVLSSIMKLGSKPIGLKLPMYTDTDLVENLAGIFKKHSIAFLTCISSMSPALVIDPETERALIKPKGGIGGMGGAYVKPFALANVRIFAQLLTGSGIAVIGVGGVNTGKDAFEFLLAGADAVQVGTAFYEEGPSCFTRLTDEFSAIMQKKGYARIADAKGKLKLL